MLTSPLKWAFTCTPPSTLKIKRTSSSNSQSQAGTALHWQSELARERDEVAEVGVSGFGFAAVADMHDPREEDVVEDVRERGDKFDCGDVDDDEDDANDREDMPEGTTLGIELKGAILSLSVLF
jgi:hypothetical protein